MHLNLLQQVGCTDTDATERRKYGSNVVVNVVFVVIIVVVVVIIVVVVFVVIVVFVVVVDRLDTIFLPRCHPDESRYELVTSEKSAKKCHLGQHCFEPALLLLKP